MKKTKFLVLVLAVSIMLVGAGYAYWDQTLTINNTVTAGNLDVQFVNYEADDWDDNPAYRLINSDLVKVEADIADDGQSIDFTVSNFYPGAGASLGFVIKNTGSVAAKIEEITGTITNNAAFANALNYEFNRIKVIDVMGIPLRTETINVKANNVTELAQGLTNALKDIKLDPGEKLILYTIHPFDNETPTYEILMPSSISGSQFENATTSFRLSLKFVQVN